MTYQSHPVQLWPRRFCACNAGHTTIRALEWTLGRVRHTEGEQCAASSAVLAALLFLVAGCSLTPVHQSQSSDLWSRAPTTTQTPYPDPNSLLPSPNQADYNLSTHHQNPRFH